MNIIITGCCGHIGSYIAHNIDKIKKVKRAYILDNLKSNRFSSLFNFKNSKKLKFFLLDLNDPKSLNNFKNIDIIIHCASMTNAEKSFDKKNEMYKNNLNCFNTVLNFCIKNDVKLLHFSSTSVYGKQAKVVDENCEKKYLKPQSPYAKIKLIEEELLKKNNKKLKYNTFRFGTITGVSTGIRFHTAVNKFCFNASINMPIEVYKYAMNQYRPYLSLKDAFNVIKFSINNNFFKNDIFNILTANHTVGQLLKKIKKYKKKVKVKLVDSAIMNQLSYHVDNKKILSNRIKIVGNIENDIKSTMKILRNLN